MKVYMKNIFSKIAFIAVASLALSSCNKEPDYSKTSEPRISLMMEELRPDLNRVDNTPVVCVVFSEAGLKSVNVYITENETEILLNSITEFKDAHQYSVKESPSWNEGINSVRIVATDVANRSVEATMGVVVTPVLPAPAISFGTEIIVIDERKEDPTSVETTFDVVSSNTLVSVSAKLFRAEGAQDVVLTPSFKPGSASYSFSQTIDYANGDRAFQVTATDNNGKMKIETLPINYIPAPAPEFKCKGTTTLDPITVRSSETRTYNFNVTSETGLSAVEVFKVMKDVQGNDKDELLDVKYYEASTDFDVEYAYTFEGFDNASHAIKFVATDRLNHSSAVRIPATVDLRLGENIIIGSQYNSKNPLILEGYPGEAYCFFSVRDFKTYSLFYFWEPSNRRNIDLFYFAWNYGSASDNGVRIMRANEERSGNDAERYLAYTDPEDPSKNIPELVSTGDWALNRNATLIKKLTDTYKFNFDNATVADLTSPQILSYLNQGKTSADWVGLKAGDCLVFKTGTLSTAPSCCGIIKFETVSGSKNDFGKSPVYIEISIKAQLVD